MTDFFAAAPRAANSNIAGAAAPTRLSDRLAALTPPPAVSALSAPVPPNPHFSPASVAPGTAATLATSADQRARQSRSLTGTLVRGFVAACSFVPYALVALVLRLAIASVFFLDGQTRVDGPLIPIHLNGFDFSFVLPLQVKATSFTSLLAGYLPLPVPPGLVDYLVAGAEFVLPMMLVLGFGTRFAALGLLIVTAILQIYVMPQALWSAHVYWALILLVLISCGPGRLAVDHFIKPAADA
jgi:putative oxidoreductase